MLDISNNELILHPIFKMSFFILTILEISDDYKRRESCVGFQGLFKTKALADRALLVWMLNKINEDDGRPAEAALLKPYVIDESCLDSHAILKKIDEKESMLAKFIVALQDCFDGEFVDSTVDYDIDEHKISSIMDSTAQVDALVDEYIDASEDEESGEEDESCEEMSATLVE